MSETVTWTRDVALLYTRMAVELEEITKRGDDLTSDDFCVLGCELEWQYPDESGEPTYSHAESCPFGLVRAINQR